MRALDAGGIVLDFSGGTREGLHKVDIGIVGTGSRLMN